MRIPALLSLLLIAASAAHSAQPSYFKLSELRRSETAKEQANRSVKLFWGDEKAPEFAEMAPPDTYTRSSISLSPFGGSQRHCVDGFEMALTALVDDALARGYDAIINIRPAMDGKPSADATGFYCKPGYKTTEVSLSGTFAMTQAALDRATEQEQRSAVLAPRPPAKGAIFMALGPILSSPEAKSVLGTSIEAYAGLDAPAYRLRYGPDTYYGEGDLKTLGPEGACKQAVLKALDAMVEVAKEKDLDMVIKVRSFVEEQYPPVSTDVECEIGKKVASVSLRASLAKRK
jgi:uncharacterized protein YbjQ (UPF0145 family)